MADAEAAPDVDRPDRDRPFAEGLDQRREARHRVGEGGRLGELRADVHVRADDLHALEARRFLVRLERLRKRDPELRGPEPGGDIWVGLWVHVGIHPERHGRAHAQLASDLVEGAELAQRLDVEHEDLGLERVPHLVARLTDAREDNPGGRESRAQRAEELAARDDVGAGAWERPLWLWSDAEACPATA